jgi:hypothetical protein
MAEPEKKAITPLAEEDRTRAIRLQEEIISRLVELSFIWMLRGSTWYLLPMLIVKQPSRTE